MASALNFKRHNVFANNNVDEIVNPGSSTFRVISGLIKTQVQTARESHDLNLYFRSFDNGFKQLSVTHFLQGYIFTSSVENSLGSDQMVSDLDLQCFKRISLFSWTRINNKFYVKDF